MVNCEKHRAIIPESTCIARQKIIRDQKSWNVNTRVSAAEIRLACEGCKTGETLLTGGVNMPDQKTKECRICGQPKQTDCFHKSKNYKDGVEGVCKTCKLNRAKELRKRKKGVVVSEEQNKYQVDPLDPRDDEKKNEKPEAVPVTTTPNLEADYRPGSTVSKQSARINELVDAHWNYQEKLLSVGQDKAQTFTWDQVMEMRKWDYTSSAKHFYGHGFEDAREVTP